MVTPDYIPKSLDWGTEDDSQSNSASIYQTCTTQYSGSENATAALQCIAQSLQDESTNLAITVEDITFGLNIFFLIFAASLMFFMQAGFAMLCAGCVRQKNVQNTMLKNLLDACGAAIGFWSVGFAFAYGGSDYGGDTTFIGNTNFFMMDVENYAFWVFQFAFAATSATIVAGTLAERCQMAAYLCYSIVLTGFVYPVIVHAVWSVNGWLSARKADPLFDSGMVDFAGSGVVHVTGGFTALIATKILGPRAGRFEDERGNILANPKKIKGHSVSLQVLGTFILWFGWYGFNAGSTLHISDERTAKVAALAIVSTTLGAASGCITSLCTSAFISERRTGEFIFDVSCALNGLLSGLVSITAGCALIEPWAAVLIGAVAGWVYLAFSELLVRIRVDDAVDAIPVHFANGVWGVIAVGLFATPKHMEAALGLTKHVGWFYSLGRGSSDATLLGTNIIGLLFILGWVLCIMTPFFLIMSYLGWFRADPMEEIVGLDISYHGGLADHGESMKQEFLQAMQQRKRVGDHHHPDHLDRNDTASDTQ